MQETGPLNTSVAKHNRYGLLVAALLAALPLTLTSPVWAQISITDDIQVSAGNGAQGQFLTEPKACVLDKTVAETWLNSDPLMKAYYEATKKIDSTWSQIDWKLFLKGGQAIEGTVDTKDEITWRQEAIAERDRYHGLFQTEITKTIWGWAVDVSKKNSAECFNCELLDNWGYLGRISENPTSVFDFKKMRDELIVKKNNAKPTASRVTNPILNGTSKIVKSETGKITNGTTSVKLSLVSVSGMEVVNARINRLKKMAGFYAKTPNKTAGELIVANCATGRPAKPNPSNYPGGVNGQSYITAQADYKKKYDPWIKACVDKINNGCFKKDSKQVKVYNESTFAQFCRKSDFAKEIESLWDEILADLSKNTVASSTDPKSMKSLNGPAWRTDPKVPGGARCPANYKEIANTRFNID